MLVECVEDHSSEVSEKVDWRMWAVSGCKDDDNALVTLLFTGLERRMEELVCGGPRLGT